MAIAPTYEFPELNNEFAEGQSYYSGTQVFHYQGDDDTWDQSDIPDDQTRTQTILERLEAIEQALNL